jgi:hypothetical protein
MCMQTRVMGTLSVPYPEPGGATQLERLADFVINAMSLDICKSMVSTHPFASRPAVLIRCVYGTFPMPSYSY